MKQATQKRLELSTSAVTGRRSNQLSHWAIMKVLHFQNYIHVDIFESCDHAFAFYDSPIIS